MNILGISAFYHDSAAAILRDGKVVCAAQEERFTRIKGEACFPTKSIEFCLSSQGLKPEELDYVVFYEKPFIKFERIVETYLSMAPKGFQSFKRSLPTWAKDKIFLKHNLLNEFKKLNSRVPWENKLKFSDHHLSHAASAYYPSPFQNALVLTMDGVGEWASTSVAIGSGEKLIPIQNIHFPHSLGLFYSAFTSFLGFQVNSGEYKVMGLAPYGQPKYVKTIYENLIDVKTDGSFHLNIHYFDFAHSMKMLGRKFSKLFNMDPRGPENKILNDHLNMAASVQCVLEEVILSLLKNLRQSTGQENLCLAGGVALNAVANGKILQSNLFKNVWIQPAAGDAGGALGAAYAFHYLALSEQTKKSKADSMSGAFLGPEFSDEEILKQLKSCGAIFERLDDKEIFSSTAQAIAEGEAIAWFQGAMEFGPRSLGARSILADPRDPQMQKKLNLKIKFRESFRPFAPAILKEELANWFNVNHECEYMQFVVPVAEKIRYPLNEMQEKLEGLDKLSVQRSKLPAVTHIDYSARVQSVDIKTNPRFYQLIKAFYKITGCPVLINTSFNVRGEPIVCSPIDAFRCFMGTDLDRLVIGNYLLIKNQQIKQKTTDFYKQFRLD